jgi:hypothetical protein
MTIAMLVRRPPYVLVAADQLYTGLIRKVDQQGRIIDSRTIRGFHRKVEVHPRLPLAFATAGIAVLGSDRTSDIISEVLRKPLFGRLNEIIPPLLRERLAPLVTQELAMGGYDDVPPEQADVRVYLAVFDGGMPRAAVLTVGRTSKLQPAFGVIGPPSAVVGFYRAIPTVVLFAHHLQDPSALARHMRNIIAAGIAEDRRQRGLEATAGGAVDVAIVGPHGSQLLEAPTLTQFLRGSMAR